MRADLRSGAYYVTVRRGASTIYALGPFRRHSRALGLVDAVRLAVLRAGLDPWAEYGYGTANVRPRPGGRRRSYLPAGELNELLHVGPDWKGVATIDPPNLSPRVRAVLLDTIGQK